MYVEYDKLLPDVIQYLVNEGVKEDSFNRNRALYAIQQAYREFVYESEIIRRTVTIPTQYNVHEYQFNKHDGYVVKKINSIRLEYPCDVWKCLEKSNICNCGCCHDTFSYNSDGALSICPAPECDGMSLEACVVLFPESGDCLMESRIYELYKDYIVHGAVARLLGKQAGISYTEKFTIGIDLASGQASQQWASRNATPRRRKWRRR